MEEKDEPAQIVTYMYAHDAFSRMLGMEVRETGKGHATVQLTVSAEMLNGFSIAHGGITYSLADSALAFAANSHGNMAVSVETSISHLKAVQAGDVLTARASEKSISNKIAVYEVVVENQNEVTIALFKGTVYRTSKEWKSRLS